ncbi:hypothetical protein EYC84_009795 [Monilinia fructicola]|uniref:Uncharacterized protein n=1 Tax=Monilinia fructicola TaxID=38448 RepID=A0A5M9J974_MONFR|nr:hypothetical protein EYC84_009795 [Monilinia fructicola]
MGKYIISVLTRDVLITQGLIKGCTFTVKSPSPINIRDEERSLFRYYNEFVEVTYPNSVKGTSIIVPECIMHCNIHDYYGKPIIFVDISKCLVWAISLKLAETGETPASSDKRITSDAKYWWSRALPISTETDQEYIQAMDGKVGEYYGSFEDFLTTFPTLFLAIITCALEFKTDTSSART